MIHRQKARLEHCGIVDNQTIRARVPYMTAIGAVHSHRDYRENTDTRISQYIVITAHFFTEAMV